MGPTGAVPLTGVESPVPDTAEGQEGPVPVPANRTHLRFFQDQRRVGAIVAGLAILALAGWLGFSLLGDSRRDTSPIPTALPAIPPPEIYGVDVSTFQGKIQWSAVAHSGVVFAYIKSTEGARLVDSRFAANWATTRTAGINHGAYHFFTLCARGTDQARNFLRTVPHEASALPPAVDLELFGNCRSRPSIGTVFAQITAFMDALSNATGKPVLVYMGEDFAAEYPISWPSGTQFWVHSVTKRPEMEIWKVLQVNNRAHLPGIIPEVDIDVMAREELTAATEAP